jgi:uncharacterized protein (DUF2235 family)
MTRHVHVLAEFRDLRVAVDAVRRVGLVEVDELPADTFQRLRLAVHPLEFAFGRIGDLEEAVDFFEEHVAAGDEIGTFGVVNSHDSSAFGYALMLNV